MINTLVDLCQHLVVQIQNIRIPMKEFTYTITDPLGIHARPAGLLAKAAKAYSDTTVTGRSIGGPVRVLKNRMAREYLALEKRGASLEELERVTLGGLRRAVLEGDVDTGSVMCGQVAGMLREIRPVRDILEELWTRGQAVWKELG